MFYLVMPKYIYIAVQFFGT